VDCEELKVGPQDIFKGNDFRQGPSMWFLAKLADNLVAMKPYDREGKLPMLRPAILATVLFFSDGEFPDKVSEITTLLQKWIDENLYWKLLGK
jgi:hypothetical protein